MSSTGEILVVLAPGDGAARFVQRIAGRSVLSSAPLAGWARETAPRPVAFARSPGPWMRVYDGPGRIEGAVARIRSSIGASGALRIDYDDGDRWEIGAAGGSIVRLDGSPAPAVERALGAPLAIALALHDLFLLHASALQLPSGRWLALVAPSGGGKSTLAGAAASFPELGLTRRADDQLPVRLGERPRAVPPFPQLKLDPPPPEAADLASEHDLAALVELELGGVDTRLTLTRRGSADAFRALLGATVASRLFAPALLGRHFELASHAARCLPLYRLELPRRRERLGEALARLAELD